jgi:hypothetical protein
MQLAELGTDNGKSERKPTLTSKTDTRQPTPGTYTNTATATPDNQQPPSKNRRTTNTQNSCDRQLHPIIENKHQVTYSQQKTLKFGFSHDTVFSL